MAASADLFGRSRASRWAEFFESRSPRLFLWLGAPNAVEDLHSFSTGCEFQPASRSQSDSFNFEGKPRYQRWADCLLYTTMVDGAIAKRQRQKPLLKSKNHCYPFRKTPLGTPTSILSLRLRAPIGSHRKFFAFPPLEDMSQLRECVSEGAGQQMSSKTDDI